MEKATIETKVIEIISNKLGLPKEEVTPDASFTMDLGADSLDTVELIMDFEKDFNLKISDEDAMNIKTVGDAIEYIAARAFSKSLRFLSGPAFPRLSCSNSWRRESAWPPGGKAPERRWLSPA